MALNLKAVCFQPIDDTVIGLATEEFEQWLRLGEMELPATLQVEAGTLVLVFDEEASDFFFQYDPQTDLNLFLERARLARIGPESASTLVLLTTDPLREVLLAALPEIKADSGKEKRPRWPFRRLYSFPATRLTQAARAALLSPRSFCGLVGVCRCGEPGCGSSYAWIEECTVLLGVEIHGNRLDKIWLFPSLMP